MDDNQLYLNHIADACKKIISYVEGKDESDFKSDNLTQDGVIRELEIIGEAAKHLSSDFVVEHREVDWPHIQGMRNVIIHEYFQVDYEIVWTTAKTDIPKLLLQIEKIIKTS